VIGGNLKRREKLSARLGDILSALYLCSATLKRFEAEGRQTEDAPLMHWAIWDTMFKAQNAFEGVLANYPNRFVAWWMARIIFPIGRPYVVPSDLLGHEVAKRLIEPSPTRDRLCTGMYLPTSEAEPIALLERALDAAVAAEAVEEKIRVARKAGQLSGNTSADLAHNAVRLGIIAEAESALLEDAKKLRDEVIRVDDFPQDLGIERG
ncbi:MAG: DUF1974 domain-containing protein, partial [Pseudomonadota bacterium]